MHLRRTAQNVFAEHSDGIHYVFAVIDHQQHLPATQKCHQLPYGVAVVQRQFEQRRQMRGDQLWVSERRQVQKTNTVAIASDQVLRHAQGHGGFADTAGPDQRDKALARQCLYQALDQRLTPEHTGMTHG